MRLQELSELSPALGRTVVINVHTELVTTLAVASANRHGAGMPVLVVDCDATPASDAYFDRLMERIPFDVVSSPLRPHGATLDAIFPLLNAPIVLLLDSDAEIRDSHIVERLLSYFEVKWVFGAGYINNHPQWLGDGQGGNLRTGLLEERPWMPFVLFRSTDVCDALEAGVSFRDRVICNDFAASERLSAFLAKRLQHYSLPQSRVIRHLPGPVRERMRNAHLPWLAWARRDFGGLRPNFVSCDTGAEIYQWLRRRGRVFAGLHSYLLRSEVVHYEGITRFRILNNQTRRRAAFPASAIEAEVIGRLTNEYGFRRDDLLDVPDCEFYPTLRGQTPFSV